MSNCKFGQKKLIVGAVSLVTAIIPLILWTRITDKVSPRAIPHPLEGRIWLADRHLDYSALEGPTPSDSSVVCSVCAFNESDDEIENESVDFRIIILTYNRAKSLERLLKSLNDLELDGDTAAIDIFVDRSKVTNQVDEKTVETASGFHWSKGGRVRVHVHRTHVGIIGQWIDSWKAGERKGHGITDGKGAGEEVVLILEDDLSLSPFAYRWLKAAHRHHGAREDLAGVTLQSEGLIVATTGRSFRPKAEDGAAYLYALVGSWGFSPAAGQWARFRRWFHSVRSNSTYRPYVKDLIMTRWYKRFESEGRQDSMWTMWFIDFCHRERLYTLYNNLNAFGNSSRNCLAVNRREPGLHFSGRSTDNTGSLLRSWKESYGDLNRTALCKYAFNGTREMAATKQPPTKKL